MDADAVEALATRLERQSGELRALIPRIGRLVDEASTRWDGSGSAALRAHWDTDQRNLGAVADAVQALSRSARRNAGQQRETSRTYVDGAAPLASPVGGDVGRTWDVDRNSQMNNPKSRDATLLRLSRLAYGNHAGETLPGWQRMEDINHPSGLQATLFRGPHGEVVLAYRGSQLPQDGLAEAGKDWAANVAGSQLPSIQQTEAVRLGVELSDKYPNIIFTGHSLGGGLATMSSLSSGRPAATFNAAGLTTEAVFLALNRGKALTTDDRVYLTADYFLNQFPGWDDLRNHAVTTGIQENQITAYGSSMDPLTIGQRITALRNAIGDPVTINVMGHGLDEMERAAGWSDD